MRSTSSLEKLVSATRSTARAVELAVRRADQGLGRAPQRADGQPVPVRHPRGPPAARAGLGGPARHATGTVNAPPPPPRRFRLVVPGHRLDPAAGGRAPPAVGAALGVLRNPMIKPATWSRARSPSRPAVYIDVGQPPSQDRSLADVWSALGGELKPSLDVVVDGADRGRRATPARAAGAGRADDRARGPDGAAEVVDGTTASGRDASRRADARRRARAERPRAGRRGRGRRPRRSRGTEASRRRARARAAERRARDRVADRPGGVRVRGIDAADDRPRRARRPAAAADPSLAYLLGRLAIVEARVRAAVERRRRRPRPGRPLPRPVHLGRPGRRAARRGRRRRIGGGGRRRGVDAALARARARGGRRPRPTAHDIRLRRLARAFGLDADRRGAPARRARAGPRSALRAAVRLPPRRRLAAPGERGPRAGAARRRLAGAARPSAAGSGRTARWSPAACCSSRTRDRPFLTRSLRVPDRVAAHLLGDDPPDAALADLLVESRRRRRSATWSCSRARSTPASPSCTCASAAARPGGRWRAAALAPLGPPGPRRSTCAGSAPTTTRATIAAAASREARLRGAGLVAGPVETLSRARRGRGPRVRRVPRARWCSSARRRWDPAWCREAPLCSTRRSRRSRSATSSGSARSTASAPEGFDPAAATLAFRLAPEQIVRAAEAARPARSPRRGR